MGVIMTTPQESIDALMNAVPQIVSNNIIRTLSYLGEKCVTRIRDRSGDESWFDQTGNLRSSIGYAVIESGRKIIESAFPVIKKGQKGASEGKKMIDELATHYANTYAMVVVAGMDYADYVEAMSKKDVLASTELWAKQEINEYLRLAAERAAKEIEQFQKKLGLA